MGLRAGSSVRRFVRCGSENARLQSSGVSSRLFFSDLDQNPPDGVSTDEWAQRLSATLKRVSALVSESVKEADRGELLSGEEAFEQLAKKQRSRRQHPL